MKRITLLLLFVTLLFPLKVSAASASFFTSGGGNVYPGSSINVTVYANGSDAYNAAEVTVTFSNLTYVGVSAASGWTGVAGPTRSGNNITFSGALLGSTATGSKALLNLSFKAPTSLGTGTIYASGQIALADGNGTKVTGGGNTVSYKIISAPVAPPPPAPAPKAPTVTSTTHPNSTEWYKQTSATLAWNKEEGVNVFSYEVNTKADTVPDEETEGTDTTLTIQNLNEGINYFHIKSHNDVGWGETTHFQINIDTVNPDPFKIATLKDSASDNLFLYFATNDSSSGIAYFTLNIDGEDLGPQQSGYKISNKIKNVIVTAYDKALNSTVDELIIDNTDLKPVDVVIPKVTPAFTLDIPTIFITLIGVIIVGGIAFSSYLISRSVRNRRIVR